jgi:hypothetical protein
MHHGGKWIDVRLTTNGVEGGSWFDIANQQRFLTKTEVADPVSLSRRITNPPTPLLNWLLQPGLSALSETAWAGSSTSADL